MYFGTCGGGGCVLEPNPHGDYGQLYSIKPDSKEIYKNIK